MLHARFHSIHMALGKLCRWVRPLQKSLRYDIHVCECVLVERDLRTLFTYYTRCTRTAKEQRLKQL